MVDETQLIIMNSTEKCHGKVTRVNRKNPAQKSAIDFLLTCENAEELIEKMIIDEDGKYTMTSKKASSDHNSILVSLHMNNIDHFKEEKKVVWKTKVPEETWDKYEQELNIFKRDGEKILSDNQRDMNERYNQWYRSIVDDHLKNNRKNNNQA